MTYFEGWDGLVRSLKERVRQIAPDVHITDVTVSNTGRLVFSYSSKGLTSQQGAAIDAAVQRAERVAWETCFKCGELGRLSYTNEPHLKARVFCPSHKPENWLYIDH